MLARITEFLDEIGLPTRAAAIETETVLPGVRVTGGVLEYDEERLVSPGDLLHEAGHLALLAPEQRASCDGDLGSDGGFEMGAQAWSWAALTHLGLDPRAVFHDEGYHGSSEALVAAFADRRGPGIPMLAWRGLTTVEEFPAMRRWVSDLPLPG